MAGRRDALHERLRGLRADTGSPGRPRQRAHERWPQVTACDVLAVPRTAPPPDVG